MPSKAEILVKIKNLLSDRFESPEAAFQFYDKDGSGSLTKSEIKQMLNDAEVSGWLSGLVTKALIKGLDLDQDGEITWSEFEGEVDKLLN